MVRIDIEMPNSCSECEIRYGCRVLSEKWDKISDEQKKALEEGRDEECILEA